MATNTVVLVNAFEDLKMKSSGGGGFSDGGVINESRIMKEAGQAPVAIDIAPPKGVVYGGVALNSIEETEEPAGVSVTNFGADFGVRVDEFFVQEDGTEIPTLAGGVIISALNIGGVSNFFESGGRLQYPNKLRYKLNPAKNPSSTGRVMLKLTLKQFDRPSDQTL